MQRLPEQTSITATDHGQEKRLHIPETIWELGRKRSIMIVEPPIAFLPGLRLLTPQLFAKVFANQRMRIKLPRIMCIFSGEEFCPS
jgi:hypothetical protein